MRTLLAGELAQAQSYLSDYHVKLEVQNGSGTWIDVGAALGRKWIVNASWGENVETKVMQVTFTLLQEVGGNSLSPLMTASVLNRDDLGAYAPLLFIGRLVRASVATMPHLAALDPAKYRELVTGRIDNVQQSDSLEDLGPITIICSDLGGWLMDMQIETSGVQYGTTPTGTPLETVLQNVLNANIPVGEPAVTLLKQSTSNFGVTDWAQGDTKVLDALSTLVLDSTGEDIRYRYDAAHVSRLTWFNPDRTRTTVDATFAPGTYLLRQLDLDLDPIRNAGEMPYVGGMARATSPSSIAAFRRRFFRLPSSVRIPTAVEAQRVIDAVVNDLSAPPGEAAAECPFLWFVQLYDRYTFQANGRQYDTDQTFAVMGYQHAIENGKGSTTLTLTARIVGAFSEWLRRIKPAAPSAEKAAIRDLQYTLTDTEAIVTFAVAPDVEEVWAAYRVVAAPGSDGDFDLVATSVRPLDVGARSFTVPRPADQQVTLVQLEGHRGDTALSVGDIRRLTITGTPQVPHIELDDTETATTGTQWWKVTERGIPVSAVEVQVQVGAGPISSWVLPTRGPGAVSLVRGGTLGAGEYEHDVPLDPSRQSWIMPRLTLANGANPIVLGPFAFDRDKNPNLLEALVSGTTVRITGDSGDTKSVGLYRASPSTWKYEVNGPGPTTIDVTALGTNGVAGLGAGISATFTAKAMSDPVSDIGVATLVDTRDVIVSNGAGAPAASWVTVQADAPGVGSNAIAIRLQASAAPVGWTAKVWVNDPEGTTLTDVSAALSPALTTPPTVLTTYNYGANNNRVNNGPHATLITVAIRAYLYNAGVLAGSGYVEVSYYAPSVI